MTMWDRRLVILLNDWRIAGLRQSDWRWGNGEWGIGDWAIGESRHWRLGDPPNTIANGECSGKSQS
jgi:hypothetical protein